MGTTASEILDQLKNLFKYRPLFLPVIFDLFELHLKEINLLR